MKTDAAVQKKLAGCIAAKAVADAAAGSTGASGTPGTGTTTSGAGGASAAATATTAAVAKAKAEADVAAAALKEAKADLDIAKEGVVDKAAVDSAKANMDAATNTNTAAMTASADAKAALAKATADGASKAAVDNAMATANRSVSSMHSFSVFCVCVPLLRLSRLVVSLYLAIYIDSVFVSLCHSLTAQRRMRIRLPLTTPRQVQTSSRRTRAPSTRACSRKQRRTKTLLRRRTPQCKRNSLAPTRLIRQEVRLARQVLVQ